jgi:hypothetical protein
MNTLGFIIADNNNNINNRNNMLDLIPVVTIPLTVYVILKAFYSSIQIAAATAIKAIPIKAETICAALIAIAIVYLFNMILEEVGNRLDNTFNKLKAEIKEKDEIIAKLLQKKEEDQKQEEDPKQI